MSGFIRPFQSVQGAVYRGDRSNGINKQRALTQDEIKLLFTHRKMKNYAADPEKSHCCWLPLIGLFTGARIMNRDEINEREYVG